MQPSDHPRRTRTALLGLATLGLVLATSAALLAPANATHLPSDKVGVASSTLEMMSASFSPAGGAGALLPGPLAALQPDTRSDPAPLLAARMRTSNPTDLIFQVTAECALWTNITVMGNDESSAEATVRVWATLDGAPVPVASGDDGRVVFCNRLFRMNTTQFDDEDATIRTFLTTRAANAFNWVALDVGSGIHDIGVFAELETQTQGTGEAKAAVGKRTLVVEPVKLAGDVSA